MPTYNTTTTWKGGHLGAIACSNGARMDFSAPAALYGQPNVITPEDAFVGALNMCFQLMFIWSVEKMKIDLVSYECEAEGFVEDLLDRTSVFKKITLKPRIEVRNSTEYAVRRALKLAEKFSLVAQSIKTELVIEPKISVI
ncbi:MAG: OsmC family protein [Candidatus Bathyarchaeota archaeon]